MARRFWTALGALCLVGLCACAPEIPVVGDGDGTVIVINDLGKQITSLEVLAGAPEGFEAILPTEDVPVVEPGQSVEVHYEVGQAVYDPETEEASSHVGDAPNAVYLDENGRRTSDVRENGVSEEDASLSESLEDEISDAEGNADGDAVPVDGTDSATAPDGAADGATEGADGDVPTTISLEDSDGMPIQGDAIRVEAGGETLVFDLLDLSNYSAVSLRTTEDGVNYVDFTTTDGQTGSTRDAATQAHDQWLAAQEAARQQAEQDAADVNDPVAENGTDPDASYDEGYSYDPSTEGQSYDESYDQGYDETYDDGTDDYYDDSGDYYDESDSGSYDGSESDSYDQSEY